MFSDGVNLKEQWTLKIMILGTRNSVYEDFIKNQYFDSFQSYHCAPGLSKSNRNK